MTLVADDLYPRRLVRCVNQLVDPTIDAAATQSKIGSMTTPKIEDVLDELEMRVGRVISNTERARVQPNSIGAIS